MHLYHQIMSKSRQKSTWEKTRKFFNDVHLWLGLASGIVLIAVCLSGTIYVYEKEIKELASPELYKVDVPANKQKIGVDRAVAIVKGKEEGQLTSVTVPAAKERTYQVSLKQEGEERAVIYYVNPYSGEITGDSKKKDLASKFMSNMFSLHRWLLLDKIEEPLIGELPNRKLGSYITGTATILFTLGVITGMIIWFPKRIRNWRQGLKIKFGKSWKRTNHDLHNTLAFYSVIFLFLMGVTGPQWSFEWYRTGLRKALGTYKEQPKEEPKGKGPETSVAEEEEKPEINFLPVSRYLAAADANLAYDGDYRVSLPTEEEEPVSITKTRTGFFAPAAGDKVSLLPATAAVDKVEIFRDKPFNERVSSSIKAIHVGNVYGSFTKLLYFFACLVATSLPVTGTMIWLNKMKKHPAKRKKKAPAPRTVLEPAQA